MDYGPKLQKQRSCSCPFPTFDDIANCFNNRRRATQFTGGFDGEDSPYGDEFDANYYHRSDGNVGLTRLRGIWRKIVKEKRRIFDSAAPMHEPSYDAYTYAQNFDEGSAWVEPENLARSFSARFAVPSTATVVLSRLS